jgi:para-aminobenzoate synthetase
MSFPQPDLNQAYMGVACERVVAALRRWRAGRPICVALDGASGTGKSTLAACVASQLDLALIPLDDFFAADIPDHRWDTFTIAERLERVFDWPRVREDVLLPLRAGQPARWHAFDFVSGLQPDGTYRMQTQPSVHAPTEIILLEGAYSAHPALAGLIDYTILVEAPAEIRRQRLAAREEAEFLRRCTQRRWHQRWDPVEDLYFNHVRPRDTFDLVIS